MWTTVICLCFRQVLRSPEASGTDVSGTTAVIGATGKIRCVSSRTMYPPYRGITVLSFESSAPFGIIQGRSYRAKTLVIYFLTTVLLVQ